MKDKGNYGNTLKLSRKKLKLHSSYDESLKALAHFIQNCKDFSQKIVGFEISCPYVKLLKKSLQLWKKVVMCMEDTLEEESVSGRKFKSFHTLKHKGS